MRALRTLLLPAVLAATFAGCAPVRHAPDWAVVHDITPDALVAETAAADPWLAAGPGGRLALTWATSDTAGGTNVWLALSADSGAHFGVPVRLNEREGEVDSYSESRPVAAFGIAGQVVVAWTARRDSSAQGDDIAVRSSGDGGATFDPEQLLNADARDPRSTYHGFVALDVTADGRAVAAWIDGRAAKLAPGEDEPARSTIRMATSGNGGRTWRPDALVASEVCSCCRLALRADSLGRVAVAYRGARDDERDPRLAISRDGGMSFAVDTLISADLWKLPGCPSIGPGLTFNRGNGGLYAWFTGSEHVADGSPPGAYVAGWRLDGGLAAPKRALADSLRDVSRPLLTTLGPSSLVAVLGRPLSDSTRHVLALRALDMDGAMTPWLFLGSRAQAPAIAGSGPRLAYAAWMEKSADGPRVRAVRIVRR